MNKSVEVLQGTSAGDLILKISLLHSGCQSYEEFSRCACGVSGCLSYEEFSRCACGVSGCLSYEEFSRCACGKLLGITSPMVAVSQEK